MQTLRVSPCFQEKHEDLELELEMREETGSFFSRLLSREEVRGYSSRSYYRASALGRIPFNWEAEPGKPKTEELVDHDIIPPLTPPPPFLQAKNNDNSRGFSSGKKRAGLLHKIVYFLHRKTQTKAKLVGLTASQRAEITLSVTEKAKTGGIGDKNKVTSDPYWAVGYTATEREDDGNLMSNFSHMSFGRSDTGSCSSSSDLVSNFF